MVVPFAGSAAALERILQRVERLASGAADTVTVVDNRAAGAPPPRAQPGLARLIRAETRQSSYFARNRGADGGRGEWIVFLDADVDPPADLLDRYFATAVPDGTGVLAGRVVDEVVTGRAARAPAVRYALLRSWMSQGNTLAHDRWGYAQTANCAVRRSAFEAVGGFREEPRSGGDADLCFRLRAAGWGIATRDEASVTHDARRTIRGLLRQRARHGSGAAWLDREHPGSFPARSRRGLAKWTLISLCHAVRHLVHGRADEALVAAIDPIEKWAFELGRLVPNETRARPG